MPADCELSGAISWGRKSRHTPDQKLIRSQANRYHRNNDNDLFHSVVGRLRLRGRTRIRFIAIRKMTLSQNILNAIDAAVKAQNDGTMPMNKIYQAYIQSAEQALNNHVPEERIVAEFQAIANPNNQ